jgi:chromosome segregation ATPase
MSLETVVHRVEAKFLDIGRAMIQADPTSEMLEELDQLRGENDRNEARLAGLRGQVALISQNLAEKQESAALLPAQIEASLLRGKSSQAMRQALELERLRREIAEDQAEVPRLEHAIWCLEFRLRQIQRNMQRLNDELAKK